MERYKPEDRIHVVPFTRREDGPEVIIGHPRGDVFIAIPREAVEVLDLLAGGKTLEEARRSYGEKYGEALDLAHFESFIESLAERGFVKPLAEHGREAVEGAAEEPDPKSSRYHFTSIPERWAKLLFGRAVLWTSAAVVVAATLALLREPSILPSWTAFFFKRNITVMMLLLMTVGLLTTFLHEMAHLVAARAEGVLCRMSISHRLWVLVAETDMTGIWALPKSRRFLPILAGPWLDLVSAAVLILLFYAGKREWLSFGEQSTKVLGAILLGYLMRLLWQCFFFVRTDFYYVYATLFSCKDLMTDTQRYLRNQLRRVLRRGPAYDQQHIPKREMRAIQAYSLFWLAGRGAAFWTLFKISLPLMVAYFLQIGTSLTRNWQHDRYAFADALLITALQFGFTLSGFAFWIRSLYLRRQVQ
jgi:hypothetical protein